MTQGTESLLARADRLEKLAVDIEAWFNHRAAAKEMRAAAAEDLRRLAHFEPDLQVEKGET